MKLQIDPFKKTDDYTISKLFMDDLFFCYTLEDVDRGLRQTTPLEKILEIKIYGKTAIPSGRYNIELTMSARFKKVLPILIDVPGFSGVRIHPGNYHGDTEGCLLVGKGLISNGVGNSRVAMKALMVKLYKATDPISIEINR